jgi:hypothetical protein
VDWGSGKTDVVTAAAAVSGVVVAGEAVGIERKG